MFRIIFNIWLFGLVEIWLLSELNATIIFEQQPASAYVVEGSNVQLNCSVRTSFPSQIPTYFWKFNDNFIQDGSRGGILPNNTKLIIKSFSKQNHSGTYHCAAFYKDYGAIISTPAKLRTACEFVMDPELLFVYAIAVPERGLITDKKISFLDLLNDTVHYKSYTVIDASYILIQSPIIQAQPAATYSWLYKFNGAYKSVDSTKTFLLQNGSLLIPSVDSSYNTDFRLQIQHPTLSDSSLLIAQATLQVTGSSSRCPNSSIVFLESNRNVVANEGQDVILECLAVAAKCRKNVQVTWKFNGADISSSRKLVIRGIHKSSSEGSYTCSAKVGSRSPATSSFQITVKEKPKVSIGVPNHIDITAASEFTVRYGLVTGFTAIEWYTSGEKITSSTGLFQIDANNNLKILHPNPSIAGMFQIFFINDAGITVTSFQLHVSSGIGTGSKHAGSSGTIDFVPKSTAPSTNTQYGSWLIQLPVVQPVILTISKPPSCSSLTTLDVFTGTTASGRFIAQYCTNSMQTYTKEIYGPFITLVLMTRDLSSSAFTVHYSLKNLVTKQPPTTTQLSTSSPSTPSDTTRQDSTNPTSHATLTNTQQTSTIGGRPVTDKVGSTTPIGAIVGAVLAIVIIAAICIAVYLYRRRKSKQPVDSDPSRKAGQPNSLQNTYMRPLEGDRTAPRFNLQSRSRPDVVPSYDVNRDNSAYEMGYLGPEQDQMYATVGEVIANESYFPARPSDKTMDKRPVPPLPYSTTILPRPSPRPADLPLPTQKPRSGKPSRRENDYLRPITNVTNTLPSPSGSNVSKTSSNMTTPEYRIVELGENVTYESADDVIKDMNQFDEKILRNPSGRSEGRYAALDEEEWSAKENSVYESLTLARVAKPANDIEDEKQGTPDADDDYCEPFEESNNSLHLKTNPREEHPLPETRRGDNADDDYSEPYEPSDPKPVEAVNDNLYQPLTIRAGHEKLQKKRSNSKYPKMDNSEESVQPLHAQEYDDDAYDKI
eukprot:gene9081-10050_t